MLFWMRGDEDAESGSNFRSASAGPRHDFGHPRRGQGHALPDGQRRRRQPGPRGSGPRLRWRKHRRRRGPPVDHRPGPRLHELLDPGRRGQPALHSGARSPDVDAALQWIIDQVRGCTSCSTKVDVVILRSTGSNGYNDYIYAMNGVDSVETLVITSARDVTSAIEATIRNAEVVFFAGGDQCDYVRNFKGTLVETAVESVYAKGGGVGGTSAGTAIQGDFTYDACIGSILSSEALANPYHRYATFTYDFLKWANLQTTITDSHFVARDRMGRLLAFLARQIKDRSEE